MLNSRPIGKTLGMAGLPDRRPHVHVIYLAVNMTSMSIACFLGKVSANQLLYLYAQMLFNSWSGMDKNCSSTLQHTSTQNHDVGRPSPCINPCIYLYLLQALLALVITVFSMKTSNFSPRIKLSFAAIFYYRPRHHLGQRLVKPLSL